jgi:hypothetical protein
MSVKGMRAAKGTCTREPANSKVHTHKTQRTLLLPQPVPECATLAATRQADITCQRIAVSV